MKFCDRCGAPVGFGKRTCPECGYPIGKHGKAEQQNRAWQQEPRQPQSQPRSTWQEPKPQQPQGKPRNDSFPKTGADKDRGVAILSYLGILFLVPAFQSKSSSYVRFHANQGAVLFTAELLVNLVERILMVFDYWFLSFLLTPLKFVLVFLSICGIVNVLNGKAKELPIIGKIRLLK